MLAGHDSIVIRERLGDIAVLVIPHLHTVAGIDSCRTHIVVLTVRITHVIGECVSKHILVTASEKFKNLVLVVVEVCLDIEIDITGLNDIETQVDIHTAVEHVSGITGSCAVTGGHGVGNSHQQIVGHLVVELHAHIHKVPQTGADSDIDGLYSLPCQVGVLRITDTPGHGTVVIAVLSYRTDPLIVADAGVTCSTVRSLQTQVVDPGDTLHPFLALDVPHTSYRIEVGILAVGSETG